MPSGKVFIQMKLNHFARLIFSSVTYIALNRGSQFSPLTSQSMMGMEPLNFEFRTISSAAAVSGLYNSYLDTAEINKPKSIAMMNMVFCANGDPNIWMKINITQQEIPSPRYSGAAYSSLTSPFPEQMAKKHVKTRYRTRHIVFLLQFWHRERAKTRVLARTIPLYTRVYLVGARTSGKTMRFGWPRA